MKEEEFFGVWENRILRDCLALNTTRTAGARQGGF